MATRAHRGTGRQPDARAAPVRARQRNRAEHQLRGDEPVADGNELVEFNARFSGKSHRIEVPVANVLAIYARENGQGMAFPVDSPGGEAEDSGADDDAGEVDSPASVGGNAPAAVEAELKSSAAPSLASSTEKNDDGSDTPRPDDDGSKGAEEVTSRS